MSKVDSSSIVAGMHAVDALLRSSPGKINHLVLQLGAQNPKLHEMQRRAEEQGIRIHQLPKPRLDQWFKGVHQGVLAFCNTRAFDDWTEVRKELVAAKRAGYAPLLIVPAAMEDPRNLGACIRSAVALGADAVLSHNKGGAGLTPAVAKTAAGALESIAICQVTDIEKELKSLRNEGYAIVAWRKAAKWKPTKAAMKARWCWWWAARIAAFPRISAAPAPTSCGFPWPPAPIPTTPAWPFPCFSMK